MFFAENELSLELIGVFKIERSACSIKSFDDRNYDSLSLRLDGNCQFKTNENEITVDNNHILYIPKHATYTQNTSGETVLAIHFINYSFNNKNRIEILSLENSEFVKNTMMEMYKIWKEKKQGYRYKCISLLYSVLFFLNCNFYDNHINTVTSNDELKNAMDYIHSHYRNEQICIADLAVMCAVSETYFRKMFKKIYLISPSQYIINLRLEYASQLLLSHLYTISEVSEKSGFCDSKYFCRLFKKHFGCTPFKYKNTLPEKIWK